MAYFDNAATTFPKPACVYTAMDTFYRRHGGSAGRGEHSLAQTVQGMVEETRALLQEVLCCPQKQIIFTPTATLALNMILQGLVHSGIGNIYISPFEHNAVTRILHHFEKLGQIRVRELPVSSGLQYDLKRTRYLFQELRPDCVVVSHASNVIGLIAPVEEIFTLAKEFGAVTVTDMAQTAGLVPLQVGLDSVDFAVFAGHKTLMGPTGLSGFAMKRDFPLPPVLFGGTGYDSANQEMPASLPERYEMGTLNTLGMAGLHAALQWLKGQPEGALYAQEVEKREQLLSVLEEFEFLHIVGNAPGGRYVGIVSCLMEGISSDSAGGVFAQRGIAVRTGLQCAPRAHRFLGTFPAGTIRFSVNSMTSESDFEQLREALCEIEDNL